MPSRLLLTSLTESYSSRRTSQQPRPCLKTMSPCLKTMLISNISREFLSHFFSTSHFTPITHHLKAISGGRRIFASILSCQLVVVVVPSPYQRSLFSPPLVVWHRPCQRQHSFNNWTTATE